MERAVLGLNKRRDNGGCGHGVGEKFPWLFRKFLHDPFSDTPLDSTKAQSPKARPISRGRLEGHYCLTVKLRMAVRYAEVVVALLLLVVTASHAQIPQKMPNIGYLSYGYNLVLGNPLGGLPYLTDPGWTLVPVINFTYFANQTSSDGQWLIPDQVDAASALSCYFSASVSVEDDLSAYQTDAALDVGITVGYHDMLGSAAFSASAAYQDASKLITEEHEVLVSSKALCQTYIAKLAQGPTGGLYNVTWHFSSWVAQLPTSNSTASLAAYFKFIANFGTHYPLIVHTGAKATIQYQFTSSAYQSLISSGVSVSLGGELSFMGYYGKAVTQQTSGYSDYVAFQSASSSNTVFGLGAAPPFVPDATSWQAWQNDITSSPLPMQYLLAPLTTLLSSQYFPLDSSIETKQALLSFALENYCAQVPNCTVPPSPAPPSAWPQFHMNAAHTSQSTVMGPQSASIKWQLQRIRITAETITVGLDNTVYCGCNGALYALFGDTGGVKWQYDVVGILTVPVISSDGTLFFSAATFTEFNLLAVSSNGTLLWRYPLPGQPTDGTLDLNGVYYMAAMTSDSSTSSPIVLAFSADGTVIWNTTIVDQDLGTPVVAADGTIYVCGHASLWALSSNGKLKWHYANSESASPAVAADGTVFVSAYYSWNNQALNALWPNGTLRWSSPLTSMASTPAIGSSGVLYVTSVAGFLAALNSSTGELLWSYNLGSYTSSSPALGADETVYVGAGNNTYAIVAPSSGNLGVLKWSAIVDAAGDSNPSLGPDGTLYVSAVSLLAFGNS